MMLGEFVYRIIVVHFINAYKFLVMQTLFLLSMWLVMTCVSILYCDFCTPYLLCFKVSYVLYIIKLWLYICKRDVQHWA